jgi:hypothetical protein
LTSALKLCETFITRFIGGRDRSGHRSLVSLELRRTCHKTPARN